MIEPRGVFVIAEIVASFPTLSAPYKISNVRAYEHACWIIDRFSFQTTTSHAPSTLLRPDRNARGAHRDQTLDPLKQRRRCEIQQVLEVNGAAGKKGPHGTYGKAGSTGGGGGYYGYKG
jgi:hypothetical protein